jgi:PhnB protein
MQVQPYLMFNGRCDEAIAFYQEAIGAEVTMLMRFNEAPDPKMREQSAPHGDRVMHACLRIGETTVFASDGRCGGTMKFEGFTLSLTVATDAEADETYAKLAADGGTPQMPLTKTFWSPKFGMLTDKFGVGWMVMVG